MAKTTERVYVTDPRKRFLGKTDMVVDFLLPDPPKPERKASLTPGQVVLVFNSSKKLKDELGNEKYVIFRFLMTSFSFLPILN